MALLYMSALQDKSSPKFDHPAAETPEKLLEVMCRKMKYESGTGYTSPAEIRKDGIAQCWGAADFEFEELTTMGFKPAIIFLSIGHPPSHTHTAAIFKRSDKWYWLEWAWGKHEDVNGPFDSLADVKDFIIKMFVKEYGQPDVVTVHHAKIGVKDISDSDYLKKAADHK